MRSVSVTITDQFDLYGSRWKFGGGPWALGALRGRERPVSGLVSPGGIRSIRVGHRDWSLVWTHFLVLIWCSIWPLSWGLVLVLTESWTLVLLTESLSS